MKRNDLCWKQKKRTEVDNSNREHQKDRARRINDDVFDLSNFAFTVFSMNVSYVWRKLVAV